MLRHWKQQQLKWKENIYTYYVEEFKQECLSDRKHIYAVFSDNESYILC